MGTILPFPTRPASAVRPEPTLREILRGLGIKPTGEMQRERRRQAAALLRQDTSPPPGVVLPNDQLSHSDLPTAVAD